MISSKRSQTNDSFILEIDGEIREYPIQQLSEDFVEWNLKQRIFVLHKMLETAGNTGPRPKSGISFGYHLPVYITNNPKEKLFPINAANKGTGFVAKDEYLDYYLEKFEKIREQTELQEDASSEEKTHAIQTRIKTLLEFYENTDKIDLRCLAGLEIWHGNTSRNFELDPRVSLHFLGMPSPGGPMKYQQWQINCIWEKIEHDNKRFQFGVALRQLTMGHVGKSFVPGHIPAEQTPIRGKHPFGWTLWVIESLDKGIEALHS